MNWIKENKFLSGYFGVLVVGLGVLGYLLYSANAHYAEVSATYDTNSTELARLEHLPLFPNAENLAKLEDEKKEHSVKIDDLLKKFSASDLPVEPMTREQFQDKLQAAKKDFVKKADEAGIKVPEKFYMGFERYETELPAQETAPLLGRELKAVQLVLNTLITAGIVELKAVVREELPEEKSAAAAAAQPARGPGPGSARAAKASVIKNGLQVEFVAPRGATQTALNALVANKTQFIIPRLITAHSDQAKGPSRTATAPPAPVAPTPAAPLKPGQAPAAPDVVVPLFIVGDEHVDTVFQLEIVHFGAPTTPATPVAPK